MLLVDSNTVSVLNELAGLLYSDVARVVYSLYLISRRNCGNVFCKECCHLKLPIPDQQLYDPVLVCNTCHDLLLESRTRELRSQQLKKAIATASSWSERATRRRLLEREPLSPRAIWSPDWLWDWSTRGTPKHECGLWRRGDFITVSELQASLVEDRNRTERILGFQSPKWGVSSSGNHHTARMHHTHRTISAMHPSRGALFKTNQAATVFKKTQFYFSILII